MNRTPGDQLALLEQAIQRADRLLAGLLAQQAELERNPPTIPAARLAAGRVVMENAITAARRTVVALRGAKKVADGRDLP